MTVDPYALLKKPEFPRSNGYDPDWVLENQMGPNALWMLEWLCETLPLEPGMRVLDLGCGRAMTSVYLAREHQVQVWAADLWIQPEGNWRRAREAGVSDRVFPMQLEAHALPFAAGFFDAIISIDAYTYFGTDDLYLSYLSRFLRPGGVIGIVVAGLTQPIDGPAPPAHLLAMQDSGRVFWDDNCWCFHTPQWWAAHWARSDKVTGVRADAQVDGWRHWRDFELALNAAGKYIFPSDAEAIDADGGRYLGFVRVVAERSEVEIVNLYDPSLGARAGVDDEGVSPLDPTPT